MPVAKILIKIYDQAGHRVEELIEQELPPSAPGSNFAIDAQDLAMRLFSERCEELMQRQPFRCYACGKDPTTQGGSAYPYDFDSNYPGTSCVYHVLPYCFDKDSRCVEKIVGSVALNKRPGRDCDPVDKAGKICYNCGEVAELKKCSQCHLAKYCSKQCQRLGWSAHQMECQEMAMYQALHNIRH